MIKSIYMAENVNYKVLWVDDDLSIIDGYAVRAEEYNLELDHASNWEEAELKLRTHFREYSAIILDANCKLKPSDRTPSEYFLGQVSVRLARIFGEKHEFIPWYVLSAGTMSNYKTVLALINTDERKEMEPDWGKLQYQKDGSGDDDPSLLFKKIKEIAEKKTINKVLFRHAEVFKYLGAGNLIDSIQARSYVLKMLSALYNPEENLNFEYEGNPLRKVLEHLFRTVHKYGLIPDKCIENDRVNLQDSSRFLAGLEIRYTSSPTVQKIRFGEAGDGKEGKGGDKISSSEIASGIVSILDFSNQDSHTGEDTPYTIEEDKKEIFFGCVLYLAQAIKFFGRYIEEHPNREDNLAKHQIVLEESKGGKPHASKSEKRLGYAPKILSREELIGSTGCVTNEDKFYAVRGCCKLQRKEDLGKQIKIIELIDNEGNDKECYPYIVTKKELIE